MSPGASEWADSSSGCNRGSQSRTKCRQPSNATVCLLLDLWLLLQGASFAPRRNLVGLRYCCYANLYYYYCSCYYYHLTLANRKAIEVSLSRFSVAATSCLCLPRPFPTRIPQLSYPSSRTPLPQLHVGNVSMNGYWKHGVLSDRMVAPRGGPGALAQRLVALSRSLDGPGPDAFRCDGLGCVHKFSYGLVGPFRPHQCGGNGCKRQIFSALPRSPRPSLREEVAGVAPEKPALGW